jgi:hypothetical protein
MVLCTEGLENVEGNRRESVFFYCLYFHSYLLLKLFHYPVALLKFSLRLCGVHGCNRRKQLRRGHSFSETVHFYVGYV